MIKIYQYFKNKKINTFFIGQHKGPCNSSYIVIRDAGRLPAMNTNTLGQQVIDIIIICPLASFANAMQFEDEIRDLISQCPLLRRTGQETPFIIEDGTESITKSFECVIQKKL